MTLKGKLLVAKDKNPVSAVKVNVSPTARERFTGLRSSIDPGTVVLCVYEHFPALPEHSLKAKYKGESAVPYLFVIHGEQTWEANPHSYEVAVPTEKLKGRSICFTGGHANAREYWKAIVGIHGGTYNSSVTRETDYLVMGDLDSKSTKAVKAKALNTVRLTYQEFLNKVQ